MIQNLTNIFNLFVWRGMKHNNHRAQEANCTAQLSERTQLFFEKVGSKHRTTWTQQDRDGGSWTPYPMRTLNAPNGVTSIAGAKAYAAKFEISPNTTVKSQRKASNALTGHLTGCYPRPPQWHLQICKPFALEAMLISCIIETLYRDDQSGKLMRARECLKVRCKGKSNEGWVRWKAHLLGDDETCPYEDTG